MQKALCLLLSAAMLLCLHPAAAQQPNTLTGTVTDSASGKAVGYATVSLQRDSVTVVNAVAANSDGRFSLKAPETGDYQLCITMVGYTPYKQAVKVPASGKALGKIAITQGVEVGDVVIEVQKPLVMADAEKTTYSVEDDPQASTSTLDEIIRKVPQLSLDGDGNVLLNGQSNYKILLNGRNSATMSNNFKEVIQSMPASQISRIEVITNPSTKYEAEGVGGIINLITQRKKQFHGYNGSVGASVKVLENPAYNGRYSQNDFDAMDIHTDQFTFSQNLNLDFALWKEARLMLGENYSTGYAWLGGKSESYYYYYMGIKQQFLKKKLDLSIMCNNPFEKYRRNRNTSDTPTFGGWSEYRYACRSLYFRVSYRFGKQNVGVKRTATSIRNDDMSSGAQGGGGGSTGGAQGGGGM